MRRTGFATVRASALAAAAFVAAACAPTTPTLQATAGEGTVLRVALTDPTYHALDPQAVYTYPQEELLRCCLTRTLMTYAGVPGIAGTEPVPDLAVASPSVSPDGLTWTFRLRRGIRYAPPLQNVEVTAPDVIRALLRAGSPDVGFGQGAVYLPLVEGFTEYADGRADSIVGLSAPDRHTLRVQEVRSDASIEHLFALPISAPIPPSPDDPSALFGVATGHPFSVHFPDLPEEDGYGPFLVSTGPYMFEGASDIDFSLPPDEQQPASGFTPAWFHPDGSFDGRISLVRNPSWRADTDPNRPAFADRIEVAASPAERSTYRDLERGNLDVVMGSGPPIDVLDRYRLSEELQGRIATAAGYATTFIVMNVAQPPFDDPHVRRALALILDRAAMTRAAAHYEGALSAYVTTTSHLVPDPVEGSFLSPWNPFSSPEDHGDPAGAHAEMDASRYGRNGRCTGEACSVLVANAPRPFIRVAVSALGALGMKARFDRDAACEDPRAHVGLCITHWGADYPDAGNMFVPLLSEAFGGSGGTLLGTTDEELRRWGYRARHVPSVDDDYIRCGSTAGVRASLCWARLDQLVVGQLVAAIPLSTTITVRLQGPNVTGVAIDQAFAEPALDRIDFSEVAA
jgi:peptide/nickel transport system substrate-binding protein